MTPVLWDILKQFAKRKNERKDKDVLEYISRFRGDLHSFECSALMPALEQLSFDTDNPAVDTVFLPAKATWLEFTMENGNSTSYLVSGETEDRFTSCAMVSYVKGKLYWMVLGPLSKGDIIFRTDPWVEAFQKAAREHGRVSEGEAFDMAFSAQAHVRWTLSAINQPQVIGLKVHPAHKGRIKKLSGLGVGTFPLHAWHEIVIGKPTLDRKGQQVESQQADKMPLHFVRSHLKPSLGVRVPAHWRGNAAYGIKLTRYRVEGRAA